MENGTEVKWMKNLKNSIFTLPFKVYLKADYKCAVINNPKCYRKLERKKFMFTVSQQELLIYVLRGQVDKFITDEWLNFWVAI